MVDFIIADLLPVSTIKLTSRNFYNCYNNTDFNKKKAGTIEYRDKSQQMVGSTFRWILKKSNSSFDIWDVIYSAISVG